MDPCEGVSALSPACLGLRVLGLVGGLERGSEFFLFGYWAGLGEHQLKAGSLLGLTSG